MMADFSLSTWKGENQITESEMKASDIVLLQEVLGIPEYLKDSCHRQAGNYFPHKNFWKDGVFFLSNVNEQKYKPICFNYKINLFKSLNEIGEKERMIFFSECGRLSGISQFTDSDLINCYLSDTCTTISCCVEDKVLRRNMETVVKIDPCKFTMMLEIEKLQFNISLLNFTWGMSYISVYLTTYNYFIE